jgi:HPt (histidine-containing phosphotransfer) domain-containing protein
LADDDALSGSVSSAVLDPQVVGQLRRLGTATGEDVVEQVAALFLADADERVASLRDALDVGDCSAMARSAHTLRGASANIGATDLARVCATLEVTTTVGDLAGAGALLDAVVAELARVRCALGLVGTTT